MADIPTRSIAQLPVASSVNGNDQLVISQGGITKSAIASQIRAVATALSVVNDLYVGRDAYVSGKTTTGSLNVIGGVSIGFDVTLSGNLYNSGKLFVGSPAVSVNSPASQTVFGAIQVNGTNAESSTISATRFSNNVNGASLTIAKGRGTTVGDYTVVQPNDLLGGLFWGAANGSFIGQASVIYTQIIDTAPSVTSLQSRIEIRTNAQNSAVPTAVLRVSTSGLSLPVTGQVLNMKLKTPSSATDLGTQGDFCYDQNYLYVCVATDTWRRVSIATWP